VLASIHDVVVAGSAKVVASFAADEKSDRAAVHAFEVNELIAMLNTHVLSKSECLPSARFAKKVFSPCLILSRHCLLAVLHATEVGLFAVKAIVECAKVHGKLLKFTVVEVTWGGYSATCLVAFLLRCLDSQLCDLALV